MRVIPSDDVQLQKENVRAVVDLIIHLRLFEVDDVKDVIAPACRESFWDRTKDHERLIYRQLYFNAVPAAVEKQS